MLAKAHLHQKSSGSAPYPLCDDQACVRLESRQSEWYSEGWTRLSRDDEVYDPLPPCRMPQLSPSDHSYEPEPSTPRRHVCNEPAEIQTSPSPALPCLLTDRSPRDAFQRLWSYRSQGDYPHRW